MRKFRSFFYILTASALLVMVTPASAELFWRTGKVQRVLSETSSFGGCMVQLSTIIGNGCPANGWVSMDCDGQYSDAANGKRAFATALVARSMDQFVSIRVDNTKKHDAYCVGKRLDF